MVQSKISPNLVKIVGKLLDFVKENLISKIELEYVQLITSNMIDKLKLTAELMSDENPNNREQLKNLWGAILTEPAVAESVRLALFDAVAKIKDSDVKEGLTLLINPITDTLVVLSDKNTADGEQLEKIWLDFVKSEAFLNFAEKHLETLLKRIIKNESIVELISLVLRFVIQK